MQTGRVRPDLDAVFSPRSVAVIGASEDPAKRGHHILKRLLEGAYGGDVYAVNPRGGTILGHPVFRDVDALPAPPDLAVICTPASSAPELVEACGRRGIPGAVILAVGFRETGVEGAALESRVQEAARAGGVRVVGPNTSGLLNLPLGLNLIGVPGVRPGTASLLVQSGNVALALMKETSRPEGPGIAVCAGLGNEVDVGFGEALAWLGSHEATRVVLCYTEGIREGRAFLAAAAEVTRRTPVVLIAAGRTVRGAQAARSHTGAVAGPWDRLAAGLDQAGVIVTTRTDELAPLATTLATQPPAGPGTGVAVLSDGGGHGSLAADALHEMGVRPASLSPATVQALRERLGPAAATGNPVDLAGAGDSDPGVFADALDALVRDADVGAVLVVGLFGGYAERFDPRLGEEEDRTARALATTAREAGKGLVVHSLYALDGPPPLRTLAREGVPVVASFDAACRCVAELWRRGRFLATPPWRPGAIGEPGSAADTTGRPSPEIGRAIDEGRDTLTEIEARALLASTGVELPPAELCATADEAVTAQARFARPVALKVVSPRIPHKTEAGGVILGVDRPEAVRAAFDEIESGARAYLAARGAPPGISGMLVTPMLPEPLAELLVGVRREPGLGPMLTLGAGGIWVEGVDDVGHRVLPVDEPEIRRLLDGLRIAPVLKGARGRPGGDIEGVVSVARALSELVTRHPAVADAEINPLFVYPDGVVPVDVRVLLESASAP